MDEYIDKDKLIDRFDELCNTICQYSKKQRAVMCSSCELGIAFDVVDDFPTEDVQPVVRCKDCIYWKDWHVRYPDGRERQYLPEEYEDIDGYKLLVPSVTSDVGINVAPQCMYEKNRGWSCDKTVFKNADDYCSRAEKRTSSYESWWGICDGWYALESGD